MRWLRRKAPSASVRTPVIVPPPPAALFSEYIKKKPRRPSPVGTISSMLHAANPSGGVNETVRTRLAMVLYKHQQPRTAGDPRFPSMTDQMVSIAIERLVFVQGNLRLGGLAPTSGALLRHFAGLIMNEDVSVVLDAVGAYADAHARVPGVPWMKDAEEAFLADVEDVLASTEYGVRGRELVLRTDLASAVLVDEPLRLLSAGVPALEKIDLKYREAVAELSAGKTGGRDHGRWYGVGDAPRCAGLFGRHAGRPTQSRKEARMACRRRHTIGECARKSREVDCFCAKSAF